MRIRMGEATAATIEDALRHLADDGLREPLDPPRDPGRAHEPDAAFVWTPDARRRRRGPASLLETRASTRRVGGTLKTSESACAVHGTMTSRSMGSTCTPLSLSHLTPRSSAPSSPSSSSAIHPWSAFTSARRMLMTRSKSLTRRYTIGSWISSVGNVSRRRMRGIASTGSTAPGDGGNDRDLIAVLEHRLLRLEEPDVLLVHVDIDEAPQLTRLVHEPFLQPGELALQVLHETLHRVALGLDLGVALRERAERGRDSYEHRHARSSYTAWDLRSASARSKADSDGLMFTWASRRPWSASGVLMPLPVMQMTIDSVLWMTPVSMSFRVAATVTPPAVSVKMPSVRASTSIPSTISSSATCAPKPPDSFTVL